MGTKKRSKMYNFIDFRRAKTIIVVRVRAIYEQRGAAQLSLTQNCCGNWLIPVGRGPSCGPHTIAARAQPACSACMTSRPGAYPPRELATPSGTSWRMPRHEQSNNCVRTRVWSKKEGTRVGAVPAMSLARASFVLLAILLCRHEVCGHVTMICTSTPSDAGCVAGGTGGVAIWLGTYHGNQRCVRPTFQIIRVHDGCVSELPLWYCMTRTDRRRESPTM